MKKTGVLYLIVTALSVFLLSGCGGGHGSGSSGTSVNTAEVKQVGVITSPALEMYGNYKIYVSADIKGMDGAQYFVAGDLGSESSQATLNLGFSEELNPNSSLAVVNASTGRVVFAYDPSGTPDKWKDYGSNVSISGGKLLRYNGLTINQSSETETASVNLDIDDSEITYITLSSTGATMTKNGTSTQVPSYDYVWHLEPDYRYEYFEKGLYGDIIGSPSEGTGYKEESDFKANDNSVYIAHDIHYMTENADFTGTATKDGESEYAAYYDDYVNEELAEEKGENFAGPYIFATLPMTQGSTPASVKALMTHSASDAYENPVLHITEAGTYQLTGTWNGQVSVEADAVIILDGVTVTCTVAPAVVFTDSANEYAGDYKDEDSVSAASMDLGQEILETLAKNKANIVLIADGSTNTVTGANVYRLLKAEPKGSATKVDGTDISDQKKLYKLDGAFYSYVSLAICGEENGTGILNINSSTLEGLDSELHLTVESGQINITAPDDGINVNEDDVSVFTQLGGTLTIKSEKGDGIDSNGYIVINGGTLNITAGNQSDNANGESGLDSEKGTYVSKSANYTWTSISGGGNPTPPDGNINSGDTPPSPPDGNIMSGDTPPSPPSAISNDVPSPTPTPTVSDDTPAPTSQDISGENNTDTDTDWQKTQWENYRNTSDSTTSKEEKYKYNDADVLSAAKQTNIGITAINIGTGSNVSFIRADTSTKPRIAKISGDIFRLDREVNTFSGIRSR